MLAIALHSLDDTETLAHELAPVLATGDVLLLHGEVGAGKTTLTGALARALGSSEPARSPTYTVAHEYALSDGRRLAHLDLYRQEGALDASAWGDIEPYLEADIVCIEWPQHVVEWLPASAAVWHVRLEPRANDSRTACITAPDPVRSRDLLQRLIP